MAAVARDGLGEHRERLGEALSDAVERAARQLAPLPCFCGTGCQRLHEHDALTRLIYRQHPHAAVDHSATTAWCRVCYRWWTYEESGDSRYRYFYNVRQFDPGSGHV